MIDCQFHRERVGECEIRTPFPNLAFLYNRINLI